MDVVAVMDNGSNKIYVSKFWLVVMQAYVGVASAVGDFGCPPVHARMSKDHY
ncbi:hypothetical protein MKW92_025357 [Papaver armeniacum]|nr:hypothetical protein MKW92_025357 [Papaver armeniacum]